MLPTGPVAMIAASIAAAHACGVPSIGTFTAMRPEVRSASSSTRTDADQAAQTTQPITVRAPSNSRRSAGVQRLMDDQSVNPQASRANGGSTSMATRATKARIRRINASLGRCPARNFRRPAR